MKLNLDKVQNINLQREALLSEEGVSSVSITIIVTIIVNVVTDH